PASHLSFSVPRSPFIILPSVPRTPGPSPQRGEGRTIQRPLMMETRSRGLLLALLLLVAASAAALAAEGHAEQACAARAEDFQRLVGGLGFGPATDLGGCPFGF